jgi:hypothetical protein
MALILGYANYVIALLDDTTIRTPVIVICIAVVALFAAKQPHAALRMWASLCARDAQIWCPFVAIVAPTSVEECILPG